MTRIAVERMIEAPVEKVFQTIAHIQQFSQVVPEIINVEILSKVQQGVGTRFRETRDMNGKQTTVELEVTEYVENEHVRIVSDTHGTIWDTVFTVAPAGEGTKLNMVMNAKAYKLLPKLMNPLISGMIKKAIESDMDAVKKHCEQYASD